MLNNIRFCFVINGTNEVEKKMDLSVIVTLMGGLGLFLLGMHQMGDGMEKAAGARMRNILEAVTSNRVMGTLVRNSVLRR